MESLGIDIKLIFAQVVNFFVLLFVFQRFLFKPLLKAMDQRRKQIDEGIGYSEQMEKKVKAIKQEEKEVLHKAQSQGEAQASEILAQAQKAKDDILKQARQESDRILKQAQELIAQERESMFSKVRAESSMLVVKTAEKVLSESLTGQDQHTFVDQVIGRLSLKKIGIGGK